MIVVDASVLLAAEDADDRYHDDARRLLTSAQKLATLDLAFYEVGNVAAVVWKDDEARRRLGRRVEAIATYGTLVRVDDELIAVASVIASAASISVYDGSYVAASRRLSGRLASCDVRDLVGNGLAELPAALLA